MKPSRRDYLTIATALIAILLCGYGVGFLVGERTTQTRLGSGSSSAPDSQPWEETTLERLTRELKLTDQQRNDIANEIRTSSQTIKRARLEALGVYRTELLDLHQRLLPYLDEKQRAQIQDSTRQLKEMLDGES